jgi:hypothetical protein
LAGGIVFAAALFAAYASLAVAGVRTLERQGDLTQALTTGRQTAVVRLLALAANEEDQAVVAEGTRALLAEHRGRLEALRRDCGRVRAIDLGVRRLRAAVCAAIQLDIEGLRDAEEVQPPSNPSLGNGIAFVDARLHEERKQWRLKPGRAVEAASFDAAEPQRAQLRRYANEPLGVHLVTLGGERVNVIDIDRSTNVAVSAQDIHDAAMGDGDWLAALHDDGLWIYDLRHLDVAPVRVEMPPVGSVVPAPGTGTVWAELADSTYASVDRTGKVGPPLQLTGFLIAATDRYLVVGTPRNDGGSLPQLSLLDATTRRLVRNLGPGSLLDARGGVVVWLDEAGRVQLLRTPLPLLDPLGMHVAALDPAGVRVATVTVGDTYRLDVGRAASSEDGRLMVDLDVPRRGPPSLTWSADGKWIFIQFGARIVYANSASLQHKALRLTAPPFGELLGAF